VVSLTALALGATGQAFLLELAQRGIRVEHANLRALLRAHSVRPRRAHPEFGGPDAFDFVCVAIVVAIFAALFLRLYPGGRTPLLELSATGLHVPHRRVTVSRTSVIPVSWMVEDPEVALLASWRLAEVAR
jgi:hypothetical protein